MTDAGKTMSNMDSVAKLGRKVLHTKAITSIAPNKVLVNISGPMAQNIMECGKTTKSTAWASTTGLTTDIISENGIKITCTDTVNLFIPMVIPIKVNTNLTKNTGMARTVG